MLVEKPEADPEAPPELEPEAKPELEAEPEALPAHVVDNLLNLPQVRWACDGLRLRSEKDGTASLVVIKALRPARGQRSLLVRNTGFLRAGCLNDTGSLMRVP